MGAVHLFTFADAGAELGAGQMVTARSSTRTSTGPSSPYPQTGIVTSSGLPSASHTPGRARDTVLTR